MAKIKRKQQLHNLGLKFDEIVAKIATYFSFQGPTLTFLRPNFGKIEEFSVKFMQNLGFWWKTRFSGYFKGKTEKCD